MRRQASSEASRVAKKASRLKEKASRLGQKASHGWRDAFGEGWAAGACGLAARRLQACRVRGEKTAGASTSRREGGAHVDLATRAGRVARRPCGEGWPAGTCGLAARRLCRHVASRRVGGMRCGLAARRLLQACRVRGESVARAAAHVRPFIEEVIRPRGGLRRKRPGCGRPST